MRLQKAPQRLLYYIAKNSCGSGILVMVMGLVMASGCASDCHEKISVELESLSVVPEDFDLTTESLTLTGGQSFDTTPSKGRFPSGLAIAKVVRKLTAVENAYNLRITESPTDVSAYWNGLLDTLPPIREVTMIHKLGLDPRGASWRDILRESVRVECHLCLIYGRWDRGPGDSDLIGVLWDASLAQSLAAFRVPVVRDDKRSEEWEEGGPPEGVLTPAEYEAEAELRELVRSAVWDLVQRDEPAATTQPSPWQSDEFLFPRNDRWIFETRPN